MKILFALLMISIFKSHAQNINQIQANELKSSASKFQLNETEILKQHEIVSRQPEVADFSSPNEKFYNLNPDTITLVAKEISVLEQTFEKRLQEYKNTSHKQLIDRMVKFMSEGAMGLLNDPEVREAFKAKIEEIESK